MANFLIPALALAAVVAAPSLAQAGDWGSRRDLRDARRDYVDARRDLAEAARDRRDAWYYGNLRDVADSRREYRNAYRDYRDARRDLARERWQYERGRAVAHNPYWRHDRRGWSDSGYYNHSGSSWTPYGGSYYRDRFGVWRPGPGDYYRDRNGRFVRYPAGGPWYGPSGRRYNDYYACRRDSNLDGAVIGAVLGGLLGNEAARPGNRAEGAVLGAVLGGVAGGAIDSATGKRRCY